MKVLSIDTETARFRPGVMAPELVCLTYAEGATGERSGIIHHTDTHIWLNVLLANPEYRFVGANIAYDFAVLGAAFPDLIPAIFDAYEQDRVTDVQIRAKLIDIARGEFRGKFASDGKTYIKYNYSLADLTRRYMGVNLKKEGWRLRYAEFRDYPLAQWPDRATGLQKQAEMFLRYGRLPPEKDMTKDQKSYVKDLRAILEDFPQQVLEYPLDDARYTLACYEAQSHGTELILKDQYRQARAAFALHLCSAWGVRTNKEGVDALRSQTEKALVDVQQRLVSAGLVRADGTRDTKAAAAHMKQVCAANGVQLRLTDKGGVCLDSESCEAAGDALISDYAEFTGLNKTLNADVEMLAKGTEVPIHPRYDMADTGRTTCSGPNIQNLRRLPGIRESIVPRKGYVFVQNDYPSLELYTLAQCCMTWFGHSALGDMLKAGIDPHTAFAAKLAKITYEEGVRLRKAKDDAFGKKRHAAKGFNFGKPGGLGDARMVDMLNTEQYGYTIITASEAHSYGEEWKQTFPEMKRYFDKANSSEFVVVPGTDFTRGATTYCQTCNTPFQGLGAACAKNAMWMVAQAQYSQPKSPLWGSRTIVFAHDEIIAEAPEHRAVEAVREMTRLMVKAANQFLPDVPISEEKMQEEATIMRFWSKEAFPLKRDGLLVPWNGEKSK